MSGAGVNHFRPYGRVNATNTVLGSRSCLPYPAVPGYHEEQAEGCGDGTQPAKEEERGIDEVYESARLPRAWML
jgi:hypothetical protein